MKKQLMVLIFLISLTIGGIIPYQPIVYADEKYVEITSEEKIIRSLKFLEVPENKHRMLVRCVKVATSLTGFDEELIIALMSTESEFNPRARSPKNYKGLMQTPKATFKYPEVDTLYGAMILEDKYNETNGNLLKALALYKGGNNPVARRYARQTYSLYRKLLAYNKIEEVEVSEITIKED